MDDDTFLNLFFLIAPERFHFLKFILEGYDNLGVVSSLSSARGIVKIRCGAESFHEIMELIAELAPQIKKTTWE